MKQPGSQGFLCIQNGGTGRPAILNAEKALGTRLSVKSPKTSFYDDVTNVRIALLRAVACVAVVLRILRYWKENDCYACL